MKIETKGIAGVTLLASGSDGFDTALQSLLGRAPRELIAPAIPYSVIVANDSGRTISLLGIRFDMLTAHAAPCCVVHYSDTLRNPGRSPISSPASNDLFAQSPRLPRCCFAETAT